MGIMTSVKTDKHLLNLTKIDMFSRLGDIHDLPHDLANCVANIFYRYHQMIFAPETCKDREEIATRSRQVVTILNIIHEYRILVTKKQEKHLMDIAKNTVIDLYRYRIPDAQKKSELRRIIERKFSEDHDIAGLVDQL